MYNEKISLDDIKIVALAYYGIVKYLEKQGELSDISISKMIVDNYIDIKDNKFSINHKVIEYLLRLIVFKSGLKFKNGDNLLYSFFKFDANDVVENKFGFGNELMDDIFLYISYAEQLAYGLKKISE